MAEEKKINAIIATDCGSTTTKVILITRTPEGNYHLAGRGEAPTTVEAPFDDVTIGVINAVTELQEITGRKLVENGKIILGGDPNEGADLYLSTSSAGGGLQMAVIGVVASLSAESAQRAALGAGAIIIDSFTYDDGRTEQERVERIRHIRPDMVLFSGGTEGGTTKHLVEMAETLLMADPKPRFGELFKVPVIFAGNSEALPLVTDVLGKKVDLIKVKNVRPSMEEEELNDAGQAIHRLFLEHVMAQAPGYEKLMSWVSVPIMPTPSAFGQCIAAVGEKEKINVLAADIGGATTDVFSSVNNRFTRTVSANYGMSYNICNVVKEAGFENILRWLPFESNVNELWDMALNKMIRPTTIPQTERELMIEQAIVREALRLSFAHHMRLAGGLKGVIRQRSVAEAFEQKGAAVINAGDMDLIIGSGGALSHAPRRRQTALIMLDSFEPEGITELDVDSIFMLPHLGVLSSVEPDIALEVLHRDCLIPIATSLSLKGQMKEKEVCAELTINTPEGETNYKLYPGRLYRFTETAEKLFSFTIRPEREVDAGEGPGVEYEKKARFSAVGLVIDTRGRPLVLPTDPAERIAKNRSWAKAIGAFDMEDGK